MSAIRKPGRINETTTLIDTEANGVAGTSAVYLIEGAGKTCLIDGGMRATAPRIVQALEARDAFPPDVILVTHAHHDHTQGIPTLRRRAARRDNEIEILASRRTVPLLEDQSFNTLFGDGPYENITDVTPLDEGDTVDLDGVTLKVYDVPGHCQGHIALLDQCTGNLFVGDAIGFKVSDQAYIPGFMPPFWDPDAFHASIEKLKQVDYQSLCLGHFGYIYGDEAKDILDEALLVHERWWQTFGENEDRLDDVDHLLHAIQQRTHLALPPLEIRSWTLRALFGLMSGWNKLLRKPARPIGNLLMLQLLRQLVLGYRTHNNP